MARRISCDCDCYIIFIFTIKDASSDFFFILLAQFCGDFCYTMRFLQKFVILLFAILWDPLTNATGHLNARRMSAGLFCPIMSMLVCLCRFSFFIFTVGLIFGVKMPMGFVFYFLHLFTARNRAFHVYAHLFDSWLSAYFSVFSPIYQAVII